MNRPVFHARAVLFDWDGTLLDSYASDARSYLAMFRALGIPWSLDDLKLHYSPNWLRVYEAANLPRDKWDEAYRLWHQANDSERPSLLPGVRQVIEFLLPRFDLGIVTSGTRERVRRQLDEFQLASAFSVCVFAEDAPRRKPDPAPLQLALQRMGVEPRDSVYVGDTPEDVLMSRSAGVRAIGVLGPFPTADALRAANPEVLLDSIADLPPILALPGGSR